MQQFQGSRNIPPHTHNQEKLITVASNSNVNIRTQSKTTKSRRQKWEEKQLYEYFK